MSRYGIDSHKLYYHSERLVQWQKDELNTYPIYVEVSPVGYCNHRCSFCAVDYLEYKQVRLKTSIFKIDIMSMAMHGVKSIMYAGEGEPLLHPDIAELVGWTKRNGIDVAITTNGTPLTHTLSDKIVGDCSWIKVSCNAGDPDTYHKIHGCSKKDWFRVWKNIEYAVRMRDAKGYECTIGVQVVLLPDNAKSLNSLAKQCRDAGVDYLVIKPYSQHKLSLNTQYSDIFYGSSYDKYLDALQMYASSNFEIITRRESMESWDENDRLYNKCLSVPFFWAYVMADGRLCGCSAFLGDDRFTYGNVNEQVFHDIWKGEGRRKAIELMRTLNIDECRQNCRMHKINQFLHVLKNPVAHKNFI